jgi:hypothetical protein
VIDKTICTAGAICLLILSGAASRAGEAQPVLNKGDIAIAAPSEEISGDPVRSVIQKQMAAFERHDAQAAYGFITAHVKEKYPDPVNFLAHIRYDFSPLYDHTDYKFLPRSNDGDAAVQKIELRNRRGEEAEAVFRVIQQPDGLWLIDSFAVMNGDENSI